MSSSNRLGVAWLALLSAACVVDFSVRSVPGAACEDHAQCPGALACIDGTCQTGVRACEYDDECRRDETCNDWRCGVPACATTICISPSTATVPPGGSARFVATVPGDADAAVVFAVDGVEGGSGSAGRISGSGDYTAPGGAAAGQSFVVTAWPQSKADARVYASVTIATPAWQRLAGARGGGGEALAVVATEPPTTVAVPFPTTDTLQAIGGDEPWLLRPEATPLPAQFLGRRRLLTSSATSRTLWLWQASSRDWLRASEDLGASWELREPVAVADVGPSCAFAGGGRIFADFANPTILYSTADEGASWQQFPLPARCVAGAVDPNDPSRVLVITGVASLQISAEGGANLTAAQLPSLTGSELLSAVAFDPTRAGRAVAALSNNFAGASRCLSSEDFGATWQDAGPLNTLRSGVGHHVYELVAVADQNALFASTSDGLYRGSLDGVGWTRVAFPDRSVLRLVPTPGDGSVLWAGLSADGYFRSTDAGFNWHRRARGAAELSLDHLQALAGGLVLASTTTDGLRGTLWRSRDGLAHLTPVIDGLPDLAPTFFADNGAGRAFATIARDTDPRSAVVASDDGGLTWRVLTGASQTQYGGINQVAAAGDHVLVTEWRGLYSEMPMARVSTDGGSTWRTVDVFDPGNMIALATGVFAQAPVVQLIGTNVPSIVRTTDGWASLAGSVALPYGPGSVRELWTSPLTGLAFAAVAGGGSAYQLFRSADWGETWAAPDTGAAGQLVDFAFHPGDADRVIAASSTTGALYVSRDAGLTWSQVPGSDVLGAAAVSVPPDDATTVYAGGPGGAWVGRGFTW